MTQHKSPKLFQALFSTVLLVFIFSAFGLFLLHYKSLLNIKKSRAEENSRKIHSIVKGNFDYTEKLLIFMGQEISRNNKAKDLAFIHKMFLNIAQVELSHASIFSWSKFDWVDKNNQQTINTMTGVENYNPQDMSMRTYTRETRLDPWKLKFVAPVMGHPSHIYVIPVGVGVVNNNKNYLGVIAAGIDVNKLTNKITSELNLGDQFMLIDSANLSFILGSIENLTRKDHIEIEKLFKKIKLQQINSDGPLKKPITFENTKYIYSFDIQKYPYIILTGYDKKVFWQEFYMLFIPILMQLAFITFLVESLLIVLWKKDKLN